MPFMTTISIEALEQTTGGARKTDWGRIVFESGKNAIAGGILGAVICAPTTLGSGACAAVGAGVAAASTAVNGYFSDDNY
jgi:hypothetical protein